MKEDPNFFRIWGGISGCQHLLPLLLDAQEKIPLQEIARLTSSGVAERFRIPGKGGLQIGHDADLTLVDLSAGETVRAKALHYRHRHTPYLGRKLRGRFVRTILRGRTICLDGRLVGEPSGILQTPGTS